MTYGSSHRLLLDLASEIKDKQGEPISEGDHVWTKIRGGRHEGDVDQIVETADEAKEAGVKNPPKVRRVASRKARHPRLRRPRPRESQVVFSDQVSGSLRWCCYLAARAPGRA